MLKTIVLLNISVETVTPFILSSKEQNLFEIDIFCNIINVFAVNFEQFNASKWIYLKKIFNGSVSSIYIVTNYKY